MPAPREDPLVPAPVPTDDLGRLAEDIPCRHCGYDLRGLALDGSCPECRTAVGRSVYGDLLRFSDPAWVRRLAAGMTLYVAVTVGSIVVGGLLALGGVISFATTGGIGLPFLISAGVVLVALTAVQLFVYWRITTPDPGLDPTSTRITPHATARYCLIASSLVGVLAAIVDPAKLQALTKSTTAPTTSSGIAVARMAIPSTAAVLGLVGLFALFVYAAALARRLPDDDLAKRTGRVKWGLLVPLAIVQAAQIVHDAIINVVSNRTAVEISFALVFLVAVLPLLIFWIWAIVLIFRYRARLVVAADQATESWARPLSSDAEIRDAEPD